MSEDLPPLTEEDVDRNISQIEAFAKHEEISHTEFERHIQNYYYYTFETTELEPEDVGIEDWDKYRHDLWQTYYRFHKEQGDKVKMDYLKSALRIAKNPGYGNEDDLLDVIREADVHAPRGVPESVKNKILEIYNDHHRI